MSSNKIGSVEFSGMHWALEAIQELAPTDSGLFTRWLNTGRDGTWISTREDFAHIVLLLGDSRDDVTSMLPEWLTDQQRQLACGLCSGKFPNKLGVINGALAIFWLDTPRGSGSGRLILIGLELISAALAEIYPHANLTRSELRTLLQLTMGISLQEAAEIDGVGYETKRSQLKAVFSKTETKRQAEITATLLSHLLINFGSETYRTKNDETHSLFFRYIRDCLPLGTRHHILIDEKGVQNRYLDFGPVNGAPVVFIHHLGILYFSKEELEMLVKMNLRLLCPLRSGALGGDEDAMLIDEHMKHAVKGIRMAQQMFCSDRVTLVCPLSGCFYGLAYMRIFPELVENIIFLGAPYKEVRRTTPANAFRQYFFGLALNNDWLLGKLIKYISNKAEQIDAIKKLFEKSYADSPNDLAIFKYEFASPALSFAFDYRMKNSLPSIQHDLYHQAKQDWSYVSDVNSHFHFIHGVEDTIHPITAVKKYIERPDINATLYPIEGAGSLIYHQHTPSAFAIILNIVTPKE